MKKKPAKANRSKEDRVMLKIYGALKAIKRANRLPVLNAARNLAILTGIASQPSKAGVVISRRELRRLREAAAYASFARPILEKLGDKNPLAEI